MHWGHIAGARNEPWKLFAKKTKNFLNAMADGMRAALEWADKEKFPIDEDSLEDLRWDEKETANKKLYDWLMLTCNGEAQNVVEVCKGNGFEAWRLLVKRFCAT